MSIGVALKDCRPKDQPHGLVETVGAGARKSGCFSDLLWWRVGRHGLLRFDADTFFGAGAFAYPSSCSLPLKAIPRRVRTACLCCVRSTAVRTRQVLPATQHRSVRQRQMASHQPVHTVCGGSWSIDASAFWCGSRSNRSRFNRAHHVAVLGVDDPVGVRSHQ